MLNWFYKLKEAGKSISAANAKKIQDIHDNAASMGAGCSLGFGGMYEAAKKLTEAALPMNTSHDALRSHVQKALATHLGVEDHWASGPWVHYNGMFPEHVVYDHNKQTYKHKYSVKYGAAGSDPEIKFSGTPTKVHTAYVDSKDQAQESMGILSQVSDEWEETREHFTALSTKEGVSITDKDFTVTEGVTIEMVKEKSGKISALPKPIDIKIIAPGWGSMAYYPKKMIQESGPSVFGAGTHMYWNHATEQEEANRPEGDLSNLAAVLTEGARWEENGPKGPGLYAKAKVFSDYAQQVAEKGPHIGVSINAGIKCHEGEAEGKTGRIADKFVHAFSADFVTKAGAGGAPIVPVTESHREQPSGKEKSIMTPEEIKEMGDLKESNRLLQIEVSKMKEGQNVILAVATIGSVLKEAGIEYSQKLLELACTSPLMKEGKVDEAWAKSVVEGFADGKAGRVTGMGPVKEGQAREGALTEAENKKFKESLSELGVPEAGLQYAQARG